MHTSAGEIVFVRYILKLEKKNTNWKCLQSLEVYIHFEWKCELGKYKERKRFNSKYHKEVCTELMQQWSEIESKNKKRQIKLKIMKS